MQSPKVYFEKGRTIIVIDEPTEEINEKIKEILYNSTIKQICNLLAVEKVDEPPAVSEDKEYSKINEVKSLLSNSEKQKEIGLDATLILMAEALNYEMDGFKTSITSLSREEKVEKYTELKELVRNM